MTLESVVSQTPVPAQTPTKSRGLWINVELAKNRQVPGTLRLLDGETLVAGPFPCLGRADAALARAAGNPMRNPLKSCGDTPTGVYTARLTPPFPQTPQNRRSYGPNPTLALEPVSGQALEAVKDGDPQVDDDGHRSGLRAHGGAPGPTGGLRPTKGCLRLSDANLALLVAKLPAGWKGDLEVTEV